MTWGFVGCRRRGSPGFRPSQDHCENPGQRGCPEVGVSFANGLANGRSVIVVDRPQRSGRKSFGLYSSSTSQLHSACTDGWSSRTRRVMGGFELELVLALADRNAGSARPDGCSGGVVIARVMVRTGLPPTARMVRGCGCPKLCRAWSGGTSVFVDEPVASSGSDDWRRLRISASAHPLMVSQWRLLVE